MKSSSEKQKDITVSNLLTGFAYFFSMILNFPPVLTEESDFTFSCTNCAFADCSPDKEVSGSVNYMVS